MDIEAALKYPTNDEDEWLKTTLIGGGVFMLAWLVGFGGLFFAYLLGVFTFGIGFLVSMPIVGALALGISAVVAGYAIEVMRRTIRGSDAPPRFSDFGDLFRDGLYATAIGIVYQVPLLVLGGVGFGVSILVFGVGAALESPEAAAGSSAIALLIFGVLMLVFMTYSVAVSYVLPAALCSYAQDGEFRAAFDTDRLKDVCTSSEYGIAFLIAFGINVVASQVMQFLMFVLVGFFVQFYLVVVLTRIVAEGYADALEAGTPASGPDPETWADPDSDATPGEV